jgi:hypothetical protein
MSASPSPAPNTSAANTNPSLIKSHLYHPAERRSPTPPHSFIHTANTSGALSPSPTARPRKKMRRLDSEERREQYTAGRSTSPSNSSQSDRGEPGSDGERNKPSASPTTYEFAEPKKKRTRTLTTPHQAAVLHALLAQVCSNLCAYPDSPLNGPSKSRFPTTAMREEVGKQIGLSARKVQVGGPFCFP